MAKSIRYKIFSYPYLSEFSDDYTNVEFKLQVTPRTDGKDLEINCTYNISNDELKKYILLDIVQVAIKVSCSSTAFNKTIFYNSNNTNLIYKVNNSFLQGEVKVTSYLIAKENFFLENESLSELWFSEKPYIESGNIIGESNAKVIYVDHLNSNSKKSIFMFIADTNKLPGESFSYILDENSYILFKLNIVAFKSYKQLISQNPVLIITVLIAPVLVDILRCMINNETEFDNEFNNKYSNFVWYKVVKEKYSKYFPQINPTTNGEAIDPLKAAQKLLNEINFTNVLTNNIVRQQGNYDD